MVRSIGAHRGRTVTVAWREARRWALILPALFALVIQSLAIQPHVHLAWISSALVATVTDLAPGANPPAYVSLPKGKTSPSGDSTNCPLCQAMRGGHAVLPALVMTLAPIAAPEAISPSPSPPRSSALSHNWRGRAPPFV